MDHVGAFRHLACHLRTDMGYEQLQRIYVRKLSVGKRVQMRL